MCLPYLQFSDPLPETLLLFHLALFQKSRNLRWSNIKFYKRHSNVLPDDNLSRVVEPNWIVRQLFIFVFPFGQQWVSLFGLRATVMKTCLPVVDRQPIISLNRKNEFQFSDFCPFLQLGDNCLSSAMRSET